jgi:hypothetical protein
MATYIVKLHDKDNSKDYYLEYCSVMDKPIGKGKSRKKFIEDYMMAFDESEWKHQYTILKARLERVDENGTSCEYGTTAQKMLKNNSAGYDSETVSIDEILNIYCRSFSERSKQVIDHKYIVGLCEYQYSEMVDCGYWKSHDNDTIQEKALMIAGELSEAVNADRDNLFVTDVDDTAADILFNPKSDSNEFMYLFQERLKSRFQTELVDVVLRCCDLIGGMMTLLSDDTRSHFINDYLRHVLYQVKNDSKELGAVFGNVLGQDKVSLRLFEMMKIATDINQRADYNKIITIIVCALVTFEKYNKSNIDFHNLLNAKIRYSATKPKRKY